MHCTDEQGGKNAELQSLYSQMGPYVDEWCPTIESEKNMQEWHWNGCKN